MALRTRALRSAGGVARGVAKTLLVTLAMGRGMLAEEMAVATEKGGEEGDGDCAGLTATGPERKTDCLIQPMTTRNGS